MTKEERIKELLKKVQERYPDKRVEHREVTKNNGVVLDAIAISVGDADSPNQVGACIYINDFLDMERLDMDEAANEVAKRYRIGVKGCPKETESITSIVKDKDSFLSRIRKCLVNKERNSDTDFFPHNEYCDLMVVYRCFVSDGGSFLVMNNHLEYNGATVEELEEAAVRNMESMSLPMSQVLHERNPLIPVLPPEEDYMRVLTNRSRMYGAAVMTDEVLLESVADDFGSDFFIIPSSVDECMAVPTSLDVPIDALKSMINEVNRNVISETDFLSDNLYRYTRATKTVEIAA